MPRPTRGPLRTLRLRGCHPLRRTFPDPSASFAKATGLLPFRSPLLGESPLMSFPPGTEMFQFPGFASPAYGFGRGSPKGRGFPIRISADQRSLASPRGFSQRATSFIASQRQGIHRTPLSCSGHNRKTVRNRSQLPPPPARSTEPRRRHGLKHPNNARSTENAVDEARRPFTHSTHTQSRFGFERTRRRPAFRHGGGTGQRPWFSEGGAEPAKARLEAIGFEPTTPCLQSRCSPG